MSVFRDAADERNTGGAWRACAQMIDDARVDVGAHDLKIVPGREAQAETSASMTAQG